MRKFISVLLLVALSATAAYAGQYKIGFVAKAMNSEFWMSVRNGAEAAAKEYPEIDLSVLAPDSEVNVQQQIQIIEDILIKGVDVLCVAPAGAKEVKPVLDQAFKEGVPIVVFDSDAPEFTDKVSFVGTNNITGGRLAAEYIVKRLNGKGKVAIIAGVMGHQTAMDRYEGAKQVFDATPGIEIAAMQPANWERALAMTTMENILSTHPDLDAVFACNDIMAMGCLEAVRADNSHAFIIGFDANLEALKSVKEGGLAGTVAQNSFNIGKFAVEAAYKTAKGEPVEKLIDTGTELVIADNVDQYLK